MSQNAKPKGILFTTPMALAIREGRKFETRRMVKPQPADHALLPSNWSDIMKPRPEPDYSGTDWLTYGNVPFADGTWGGLRAPYEVGDILYVKERHWRWGRWGKNGKTKSGAQAWRFKAEGKHAAFEMPPGPFAKRGDGEFGWSTRSPMFMPRDAARTFVRVTGLGIERIQDITEEGAIREGCKEEYIDNNGNCWHYIAREDFARLIDSLHGPGTWGRNDWFWVVKIEHTERPQDG